MIKSVLFLFFTICINNSWAHKAHSHTSGRMSLAFDGSSGLFELELPAPVVISFEHKPKTPAQKMKLEKTLTTLKTSANHILVFDPSLGCKSISTESNVVYSGKKETHSEFKLTSKLECLKTPQLSEVRVLVLKTYPKLEKLEVQTLINDTQKSFILKESQETLN